MGLGRKKSHYVSFGDLAKADETEHVEQAESDAEAHLADIASRVSEARRHISNARAEAVAQQDTLGESSAPVEAMANAALQSVPSVSAVPQIALAANTAPQRTPAGHAGFDHRFVDDIDESDVESIEKRFFEERPVSIEEGMRQADEARNRHRRSILAIVLIAVLLVAGIGLVVFGLSGPSNQSGEPSEGDAQINTQDEDSSDILPPSARSYQSSEYGESEVSVYEVMEFDEDGLCSKMTLEVTFSNGATAEEFLADMRETHGSNCVDSYVEGTTGVVVIDVSGQGMTNEEYSAKSGVEVEDPNVQEVPEGLTT